MTLEFEKLTHDLDRMAQIAAQRHEQRRSRSSSALEAIHNLRDRWDVVDAALALAEERADEKVYRSARPYDHIQPLDAQTPAPAPPAAATLIATDGSQILPDRHAAYLYYLVNVGGIVYHHGRSTPPEVFSEPRIEYPQDDTAVDSFEYAGGQVSTERDKAEIEMLAHQAWEQRRAVQPLLAVLDQRLLYWPTTGGTSMVDYDSVKAWGQAMTKIRDAGALLAGYIDRPGTAAVMTLLTAMTAVNDPDSIDWKTLGRRVATQGLTDADLFSQILEPGERSKVFCNVSQISDQFAEPDPLNRVCFFFVNPGQTRGQVARVDIPEWVAADATAVDSVHALLIDQCRILGSYPYVLARADEMAVVGRQDVGELNFMIDINMQRYGVSQDVTAKLDSKAVLRGSRTRHSGV